MPARLLVAFCVVLSGPGVARAQEPDPERPLAVRVRQRLDQGTLDALRAADASMEEAAVHASRGEFTLAEREYRRALAIREQRAADRSLIAASLDDLGAVLLQMESFKKARRVLARARSLREVDAEVRPLALARTLELTAWLHRYSGDYHIAQQLLTRALALRDAHGPDQPERTLAVLLQGDLAWMDGNIEGARQLWRDGVERVARQLGADHPAIAGFERRLALAAEAVGARTEARDHQKRGLDVGTRTLATCSPELLALQADRADSLTYDGDYTAALAQHRRSLKAFESCRGPRNSRTVTVIYNMAVLAEKMGDYAEAERLHAITIRSWSSSLGPTHPFVARGLDALAGVAEAQGQPLRARTLYERALARRRQALGANHPDVAWTLTNLARLHAKMGDLAAAERNVEKAVAIFKSVGPGDDPDHLARVLALRGTIQSRRGKGDAARASLVEALAVRERIFGPSHPLAAETRAELAAVLFTQGSNDQALDLALNAEQAGREHLRFTVRYLPERQAMAYAAARVRALDLALSIATAHASAQDQQLSRIFEAVVQSRGVILDELVARTRAVAAVDPQTPALAVAVSARQRYADLVVRSLDGHVSRASLEAARAEKEEAERVLAEHNVADSAEHAVAAIGIAAVAAALPADSALVSFVKYDRTPNSGASQQARTVPSYAAFVFCASRSPLTIVPLGPAATIEPLISRWRDEASGQRLIERRFYAAAERAYREAGGKLRAAIWDPSAPLVADAARVFVIPDGLINFVNVGALPTGAASYLVEQPRLIHYLSTERDLVIQSNTRSTRGLLAVGGPSFGVATTTIASRLTREARCEDFSHLRFSELPGARQEVAEISRIWPDRDPADVLVLDGTAATETSVKRAMVGRRVVHLATHGVVLGETCSAAPAGTRAVGGLAPTSARQPRPATQTTATTENPLRLAALILAGANRHGNRTDRGDDGILTSEEIAALDLRGTEWAVLSACDTGLGELKTGEGVLGLRRAFQVAGARTVIMSLWSIEDDATRVWMQALYSARFTQSLDTATAVRAASLSVLQQRRAQRQTTHPFFWAGFVAVGDWH